MRKLSILALVVILAGALTVVGYAAQDTGQKDVSIEVNDSISLDVKGTGTVDFTNVDPGTTYTESGAHNLQVKANNDLSWTITVSKSTTSDSMVKDALTVTPTTTSGTGNSNAFGVDYTLAAPENMTSGSHTVTVTFTAATD